MVVPRDHLKLPGHVAPRLELESAHPRRIGLDAEKGIDGVAGEDVVLVDIEQGSCQHEVHIVRLELDADLFALARGWPEYIAEAIRAEVRRKGGRIADVGGQPEIEQIVQADAAGLRGIEGRIGTRRRKERVADDAGADPILTAADRKGPAIPLDLVLQIEAGLTLVVGAQDERRQRGKRRNCRAIDRGKGVNRCDPTATVVGVSRQIEVVEPGENLVYEVAGSEIRCNWLSSV